MSGKWRRLLTVTTVVAAATGGGMLISASTAAAGPKSYTAVGSPAALTFGPQTASITFANTSRNKINFNAINIAVPSGIDVSGPTLSPLSGGATAVVNGSTIELRNLNTPQSSSVTVSFSATPATGFCQSYTFASDVRQSNDFNGQLNTFALEGTYAKFSAPCNAADVTCTAGDRAACSTGTITYTGGNTGSVTVNDNDSISATLHADLTTSSYTCARAGYTPTSAALHFAITITNGVGLTSVTKTVTATQPVPAVPPATYQACYQAPYPFPALVPSELAQDFAASNFSNNTDVNNTDPAHPLYTGLLLPCGAGYWIDGTPPTTVHNPAIDRAPCLVSVNVNGGFVTTTIQVPAGDPGLRV